MLAKLGGRPILEAVLDNLREAPVDEIVAVVGADAERLREVCERYGLRAVANEEWELGQSTSVLAGLRACGGEAAVVLLGDQPFVGADALGRATRRDLEQPRDLAAAAGRTADLERDLVAGLLVLREEHRGKPAAPEEPGDPVALHDFPHRELHHPLSVPVAWAGDSPRLQSFRYPLSAS